jgi:L-threonylcarbamoyladenylate synthase
VSFITTDIAAAAQLLRDGELVGMPTETVYGLAANAYSEAAVAKVFAAKQRPLYNPLIVHIGAKAQLATVASRLPSQAQILIDKFWPGPLTLVLPKHDSISNLVTSNNTTVAVRMPKHEMAQQLLQQLDFPLVAPSANPFNYISPSTAKHVLEMLGDKIACVLDGGPCETGIESTIVGFDANDEAILHRHGSISIEAIAACIGHIADGTTTAKASQAPQAPGMLEKHYSPHTKLVIVDDFTEAIQQYASQNIVLMPLQPIADLPAHLTQMPLSDSGNLQDIASNLYSTMHALDKMGADIIIAAYAPNTGIGKAINDKLRKASA